MTCMKTYFPVIQYDKRLMITFTTCCDNNSTTNSIAKRGVS